MNDFCKVPVYFLSLDVEGYELNVLKGMNIEDEKNRKSRPGYIPIEINEKDHDNIINYLNLDNYKLHSNMTGYNKEDNPNWGGSHNDFLFIDCLLR